MVRLRKQFLDLSSKAKEQNICDFTVGRIEVFVFRAPIESPVKTSFGVMNDRSAVLVRAEDKDGAFGWGEVWCNFPGCGAEHRARLIETVVAPIVVERHFKGSVFEDLTAATHSLALQTGEFGPLAQTVAGLDIAFWDLASRRAGTPLYKFLSGGVRSISVYASGINPEDALATVERCRKLGHQAFKLKVGFNPDSDLANIKSIADTLVQNEVLMIDANQAWDLQPALHFIEKLKDLPISWIEEPLKADRPMQEWEVLSRTSPFPLAAGENMRGKETFKAAIDSGKIKVIQPDVCKWGGLTGCHWVGSATLKAGLRYCPHYLGGGIGLLASAHLLCAVGGDGFLELDINPNPLREGLAKPYPQISDGALSLTNTPGLGVEPDLGFVRQFKVAHYEIF
jgi:L-alanine-DL-glutamate epimerase-like enolase superfamily enzyme